MKTFSCVKNEGTELSGNVWVTFWELRSTVTGINT